MNEALQHFLDDPFWLDIGRSTAAAYANHEQWLSRRVETIELTGSASVKRNISVDFEIPLGLPCLGNRAAPNAVLVPIAVYQKWPPLMDFDFVGPSGHPTSLYLRDTNNKLDFGLLLGMADRALAQAEGRVGRTRWELRRLLARQAGRRGAERLTPGLQRELAAIVQAKRPPQAAVAHAANRLMAELRHKLRSALDREQMQDRTELATQIAATVDLAARLAEGSVLWVVVRGTPGTDQIVKFSYCDARAQETLEHSTNGRAGNPRDRSGWLRRLQIACSWRESRMFIALPHAGRYVPFHVDIHLPQTGVELAAVDAMAFPPARADDDADDVEVVSVEKLAKKYPEFDLPDEWIGPESSRYILHYGKPVVMATTKPPRNRPDQRAPASERETSAEMVDGRAHIYLGTKATPSHRAFLQVRLAAPRQGFVTGCTGAALIIVALMIVSYLNIASVIEHSDNAAVLLSVVPIVLGYVLVRSGEHPLEHRHVSGVRAMALIAGAAPIFGAVALLITGHSAKALSPASLKEIWLWLSIVSGLMSAGLVFSFFRAVLPNVP